MTNHTNNPSPTSTDLIAERIERFQGKLLNPTQKALMLGDLKAIVRKAEPPTSEVAINWLSIISRFVVDMAPAGGGKVAELLTHASVSSWVSASVNKGESPHSLATRRGVLDRLIRSSNGGPVRIHRKPKVRASITPLTQEEMAELREICDETGLPARRGFAAVFGCGVCDRSIIGATFDIAEGSSSLVLASGQRLALAESVADLSALHDSMVLDGDFYEVIAAGTEMGRRIDAQVVRQSFRLLAVQLGEPMLSVVRRFRLTEVALDSVVRHLPAIDVTTADVAAALRG